MHHNRRSRLHLQAQEEDAVLAALRGQRLLSRTRQRRIRDHLRYTAQIPLQVKTRTNLLYRRRQMP